MVAVYAAWGRMGQPVAVAQNCKRKAVPRGALSPLVNRALEPRVSEGIAPVKSLPVVEK